MQEFTTIKQFADHVGDWYKNQINVVQHYSEVPDGVLIEIDEQTHTLTGEMLKGFVIGIQLVLQDLQAHPPFVVLDETKE